MKFIADCYDKAAGLLPETVVPAELGMPTKMAALSYKARLLLYAASPLVNGNPDYVGFNNPDGTPLMNTPTTGRNGSWRWMPPRRRSSSRRSPARTH